MVDTLLTGALVCLAIVSVSLTIMFMTVTIDLVKNIIKDW